MHFSFFLLFFFLTDLTIGSRVKSSERYMYFSRGKYELRMIFFSKMSRKYFTICIFLHYAHYAFFFPLYMHYNSSNLDFIIFTVHYTINIQFNI